MPTIRSTVTVRQPVEAVFDYMADPRNQVDWSPNFLSFDTPPSGSLGQGTRFRGTVKNFGSMDLEYAAFERPRRFQMVTNHKMGRPAHDFTFEPHGDATRINQTVEFAPKGIARLMAPFMMPMLHKMVSNLDRQIERTVSARVP